MLIVVTYRATVSCAAEKGHRGTPWVGAAPTRIAVAWAIKKQRPHRRRGGEKPCAHAACRCGGGVWLRLVFKWILCNIRLHYLRRS